MDKLTRIQHMSYRVQSFCDDDVYESLLVQPRYDQTIRNENAN